MILIDKNGKRFKGLQLESEVDCVKWKEKQLDLKHEEQGPLGLCTKSLLGLVEGHGTFKNFEKEWNVTCCEMLLQV